MVVRFDRANSDAAQPTPMRRLTNPPFRKSLRLPNGILPD